MTTKRPIDTATAQRLVAWIHKQGGAAAAAAGLSISPRTLARALAGQAVLAITAAALERVVAEKKPAAKEKTDAAH